MKRACFLFYTALVAFPAFWGCGDAGPKSLPSSASNSTPGREQLLADVARAQRESQGASIPDPRIELSTPPGWVRAEPRPLPIEDDGFTVAYEHESGLGATFYQFTRGLTDIPNDVSASSVKREMQRAKTGIEQAAELGYWERAKEITAATVDLGKSQQRALWSQYELTVDGQTVVSDIYVWGCADAFFKLRCTSRSEDVAPNEVVLEPLLTALGTASQKND